MQDLLHSICDQTGLSFQKVTQVFGGDINQAYCLNTNKGRFFVKMNNANAFPGMFAKEAEGLRLLQHKSSLAVPEVKAVGQTGEKQWLMLEWIEKTTPTAKFWTDFGKGLAALHGNTQPMFGLDADNYIGSLKQKNKQHPTWASFYTHERIFPLCKILFDKGHFSKRELSIAEKTEAILNNIFPAESPALLHGDLWSGNFMIGNNGPVIYDPAVYYGHREMDIGMSLLFGGFDRQMYEAYSDTWPLEKNWESRVQVTQLYPLLVHAVLFGAHYVNSAGAILNKLA